MINRRERKKEETRSNIVDYAIALFKEKGFPETSMEEIAEKVDISKATLYNYFPDKGSILAAYFQTVTAQYGKEIKERLADNRGIREKLNNLLDFKSRIFGDDLELTAFYFRYRLQTFLEGDPFNNPLRSGLEDIVLELFAAAREQGEIRDDIPALVIARNFLLLTAHHFISGVYAKDPAGAGHLKEQLINLFLDGAKR